MATCENYNTLLLKACEEGNLTKVREFITLGADVNNMDEKIINFVFKHYL